MAECKIPVRIDGYKCVEDMIQDVLNYTYKGKTLKEWADSISKPHTNAYRIRSMTDEELAEFLNDTNQCFCGYVMGKGPCEITDKCGAGCWADWLKQEANE